MDVRLILLGLLFILSACSKEKTAETVFPNKNPETQSASCMSAAVQTRFIVNWEDGRVTVEKSENADVFVEEFLNPNLQKIKYVDFDYVIKANNPVTKINTQGSNSYDPAEDWGQVMVQAQEVWNQNIKGQNVVVGVVDSGVDVFHSQLIDRVHSNSAECDAGSVTGVDDDNNGFIDDCYGWDFYQKGPHVENVPSEHGTHVAGIILANHSGPTKGLAPEAKLVATNFMSPDGGGSLGEAIEAMKYVADRGAKVVNASWGGAPCIESLKIAIEDYDKKGVLFVVASGNSGSDLDYRPEYPAAYNLPNQITVAATTFNDNMASFSNTSFDLVHIAAPGSQIFSTIPGNEHAYLSGTSMAAPFVSGAAALLLGVRPKATPAQLKTALLKSVDNGLFRVSSNGRLNVFKAVEEIKKLVVE